jgi:hypothetical protein
MIRNASIDRRKFLGLGALGGVLVMAGCSDEGSATAKVETTPVEGGNRKVALKKAGPPPTKDKQK